MLYISLSEEKIGKVPNTCRNQYQCFVRECQLQAKYMSRVCLTNRFSERASWHSVRLMMLKLPLSRAVYTGAVFMNDGVWPKFYLNVKLYR